MISPLCLVRKMKILSQRGHLFLFYMCYFSKKVSLVSHHLIMVNILFYLPTYFLLSIIFLMINKISMKKYKNKTLTFLKNSMIEWNVHLSLAHSGTESCFRWKVHLFLLETYLSNLKYIICMMSVQITCVI